MILKFKFKNFRSVKNWQTLSFEASSDKVYEEYYCTRINGTKLLKLGAIYGANASGKTNILLALDFLRNLAIQPRTNKTQPVGFIPFLLDDTSREEAGLFELTFFVGDIKHIYAVEVNDKVILKESLYYYPGKLPAEIFTRETQGDVTQIKLGSKVKLNTAEQEKLQVNTLSNMSVISTYTTANFVFPQLENVYNYFLHQWLPLLHPEDNLHSWNFDKIAPSSDNRDFLLDLLHRADFNISGFDIQKSKVPNKKNDIAFEHTVQTQSGNTTYFLPDFLESSGTMRYYGLGMVLNNLLKKDAIIPIDELESSLHPDLFTHYINLFLVNSARSQLLFTTHNILFLDTDDLRKDVVWFTDKKEDGGTELYSLDDFDIRNGVSFLNAYKAGKFGAKPFLGSIFIRKNE